MSAVMVFVLLLGFTGGYGVRDVISRRRRAAVLEKYYAMHPNERPESERTLFARMLASVIGPR